MSWTVQKEEEERRKGKGEEITVNPKDAICYVALVTTEADIQGGSQKSKPLY